MYLCSGMNEETREFIRKHALSDVRQLALQAVKMPDVDLREALVQIDGRQRAREKLPTWAATEGILWPERISLEQCSSEETAHYKAEIVARLLSERRRMADLTGGLGVDFSELVRLFEWGYYVEQNGQLCELATHNFPLLGIQNFEAISGDGIGIFDTLPCLDLIYLDPARRDKDGRRTFAVEDCTPNIVPLMPIFLEKAEMVMVKLSPMLDLKALKMAHLAEIHIVATQNEVKEILLVFLKNYNGEIKIYCKNSDEIVAFCENELGVFHTETTVPSVGQYLYEPNAAIMKSGCFGQLSARFPQTHKIATNSHLYVSDDFIENFPGRKFQISTISSMNKRELRQALSGIERANIATRNFPMSVAELRRRLKIADGGTDFIFATTLSDGSHRLIFCTKATK